MFAYKPDYEQAYARHQAFFHREIIDRAPVMFSFRKPDAKPFAKKRIATHADRWLDVDYRAEELAHQMASTDFLYDAMPVAFTNMGPEIFSAWCGCGYEYGERTTWTTPCVVDMATDAHKPRLDMTHPLFEKLVQFTERLIELGRGKFIVSLTDFHPGGDHLAALRDPLNLNFDMIDHPEWVDEMLSQSMPEYFAAYGVFYRMIRAAGMPATSWIPLVHDGTYYIPSNDFSCMISEQMFERHFLPGIQQECRFYDRSIYHLDGPGALRHLDALLAIPELDAIQWVCGAGNEGFARWRELYQKIQRAGKGMWLTCHASELEDIFASLRPEGVCFGGIEGVRDRETAASIVKRIEKWQ